MCGIGTPGPAPLPPEGPRKPSPRQRTAEQVFSPTGQRKRQQLGSTLGTAQLRAPLLNAPR